MSALSKAMNMNNKRLYILFVVLFTLIVVVGFNGRVLSAIAASAQANDHQFVLSPQVRAQFNLNPWSLSYSDYTRITDMEDRISVQVPVEWADIDTGPWTYKVRSSGIFLAASTDLSKFYADGSAPGVLIGVSSRLARTYGKDQLLGMERADLSKRCTYKGSFEFQGLFY